MTFSWITKAHFRKYITERYSANRKDKKKKVMMKRRKKKKKEEKRRMKTRRDEKEDESNVKLNGETCER